MCNRHAVLKKICFILMATGLLQACGNEEPSRPHPGLDEHMPNAANLNFIAFTRYGGLGIDGHIFAIFIIILAASEAAVALAIVLQIFHHYKTVDLTETNLMKR